jgi:hypothetical protein
MQDSSEDDIDACAFVVTSVKKVLVVVGVGVVGVVVFDGAAVANEVEDMDGATEASVVKTILSFRRA